MSWMNVLMAVGMPLLQNAMGDKDKDETGSLVEPKRPNPLGKDMVGSKRDYFSSFREYNTRGDRVGPVNTVAALESHNPSRTESQYWRALYSDAAKQSKVT